jgi:probable F420-dependent oxidoreductase
MPSFPLPTTTVQVIGDASPVWGIQLPIQSQSSLYVQSWERTATIDDLAAIAVAADDAGAFYIGVCDHTAIPDRLVEAMGSVWYDTVATLGWLAGLTTKTRLLSHVLILAERHPLRAAKELATLDLLSKGRLIVGIGAGHVVEEFGQLGGPDAFGSRGRDTDEATSALALCLSEEAPSFEGERWTFDGMHVAPRPVQSPRPPLWIGGSSMPALRRTAAFGDGWLPQGTRRADLAGQIATLRALREERRPGCPLEVGTIVEPLYVTEAEGDDPGWDVPGYVTVGGPERIAAFCQELVDMGVDHLQISFRVRSAAEQAEQLARFGGLVAPLLSRSR